MTLRLRPLALETAGDFDALLRGAGGEAGTCLCTAAHGVSWDDAASARACRDRLLADGVEDGFLLHDGERAIGWCQAASPELLPHYRARSRAIDPSPGVACLTCLVLDRQVRGRGLGHAFLRLVLDELTARGVGRVHAFACRYGDDEDTSESIEFPEALCRGAGMSLLDDDPVRPVYGLVLPAGDAAPRR